MAASDPATGVATPTGVLQGCAAFSYSGGTWAPAGAGPSVATPTGVLKGIAPFSYSAGSWTPTGLAVPDVATPTGVLEGVAVYTWGGSSWAPPSGSSTPTGALRGVAGFQWDGSAWQPAGQAWPSVPTPFGVLDGVALFNWSGSAWVAASAGPPGVAVDLNFVNMTTLDPSITFTRASVATYFDTTGTMQTAASNVARLDHDPVTRASRGLLMEESRTNLLLNSATLGTQSVTTTAVATTLSFYGTGTVTMSGTFAASLVGTGAFPTRVTQTFTPTAGTLTLTVTGSVLNAQLEAGPFPTSYIPTTSASVTRAADTATFASGGWRNSSAETWNGEFVLPYLHTGSQAIIGNYTSGRTPVYINASGLGGTWDSLSATTTANAYTPGSIGKLATSWTTPTGRACLNGAAVASAGGQTAGFAIMTTIQIGNDQSGDIVDGWIRRIRYWPRVLTDAEMQQVTT